MSDSGEEDSILNAEQSNNDNNNNNYDNDYDNSNINDINLRRTRKKNPSPRWDLNPRPSVI